MLGTGINKTITYGEPQGERVLRENTTCYVTVTKNDNANIIPKCLVDLGWYEGPIDLEIREGDAQIP
jgi:hypothetical protein